MECVALKTDYHDCYDVWFEPPQPGVIQFERMAVQSWAVQRDAMFSLFDQIGIPHPAYGDVICFAPDEHIVVYTDPWAHCGEGKVLTTTRDAVANGWSPLRASRYIADHRGVTYRMFVIDGHAVWFAHVSFDDWRSNCGNGDLFPIGPDYPRLVNAEEIESACSRIQNPVFAIDFVVQATPCGPKGFAVDWNSAPKVAKTPAHGEYIMRYGSNQGIARAVTAAVYRLATEGGTLVVDNNTIFSI